MPELAISRLRSGLSVDDAHFDRLYPEWARRLSNVHWTPIAVAARAATLLVRGPGTRVLDVGSGVGKVCLVGGLVTQGRFIGIEQCAPFVRAARAAAHRLHVRDSRVRFLHGNMMALDWSRFDAFYLYNPFADGQDALAGACVRFVRQRLEAAREGTRVAIYHGFGGALPASYRLELEGARELEWLELWTKRAP